MKKKTRIISLLLAALIVMGSFNVSAAAYDGADFKDLPPAGHWSREGIDYMLEKGYMNGTSAAGDRFSPDATATRAMVVKVLHTMAGKPSPVGTIHFEDVPTDSWYCDAVQWAFETEVASGVSDTRFNPNGEITREQLAAFLLRYEMICFPDAADDTDVQLLSGYADAASVSSWAQIPLAWAIGRGILHGKSGSRLDPGGKATRAEIAVMLWRYMTTLPSRPDSYHADASLAERKNTGDPRKLVISACDREGHPLTLAWAMVGFGRVHYHLNYITWEGVSLPGAIFERPGTLFVRIKEPEAPAGYYRINEPNEDGFEIEWNSAHDLSVILYHDPASLALGKVDKDGNFVAGARLQLVLVHQQDGTEEIVDEWISDGAPHIVTTGGDMMIYPEQQLKMMAARYILREPGGDTPEVRFSGANDTADPNDPDASRRLVVLTGK